MSTGTGELRVPQRKVKVVVAMADGRKLEGVLYLPLSGPGGSRPHVLNYLDDETEDFIPLTVGENTHLIQATQIHTVLLREEDGEDEPEVDLSRKVLLKVFLVSGENVIGRLSYVSSTVYHRLKDYLNASRRFIPLRIDNNLVLISRRQVSSVIALRGEQTAE